MLWLALGMVLTAFAVVLPGGSGWRGRRVLWALLADRRALAVVLVATAAAAAIPVLSGPYVSAPVALLRAASSASIFLALTIAAAKLPVVGDAAAATIYRLRIEWLAVGVLFVAVAAGWIVLHGIPHITDEVAYQFQAKALAQGRVHFPAPFEPDFFVHTHTMVDGAKWYGIMNPGWPLILAFGYLLGTPWLVNPMLGALTVWMAYALYREARCDEREARVAAVVLAISPFLLFMSATYMAHAANLFFFVAFAWAAVKFEGTERFRYAAMGGAALAMNALIRPVDGAAAALPFAVWLAWRGLKRPRVASGVLLLGAIASLGIVATMWYNAAQTGAPMEFPMAKYFAERAPGEGFGLGFGPTMGTTIHGAEWPGYYPLDAVRVTSHRVTQYLGDLHGLPLLALVAWVAAAFAGGGRAWQRVILLSGISVVAIYIFHFYHGIAFGSRHYYLTLPATALAMAKLLARWMWHRHEDRRRLGRGALAALAVYTVALAYPPLVREYRDGYRGATPAVGRLVATQGIARAIVFVEAGNWSWKSAFPYNDYPLDRNSVIYARDLGSLNASLLEMYPGRAAYRVFVTPTGEAMIEVWRGEESR